MSGFPAVPFQALSVKSFTDTVLADLDTQVNEFLHGAGTPASNPSWRGVGIDYIFDGTNWVAVVTYTGS